MTTEDRRALLRSIEQKRNSKVIAYVTSDRPGLASMIGSDAVPILHEHILAIPPEDRKKLDLLLYSRGGESDVPWTIVSMFREYCEEGSFSVLIPYRAHSAATVLSLGADEIVMTKKAELGPIDATIPSGPYNPTEKGSNQRLPISVEDVTGYFSLLKSIGCHDPAQQLKGFEQLSAQVHPLALGSASRILQQTKLVALRLLDTRAGRFDRRKNATIIKRLSSEIYSHNHTISRSEAIEKLGLEQVIKAENLAIDEDLWALYSGYKEFFSLEQMFAPEEYIIINNIEEHTWPDLPLACIESSNRLDVFRSDLKVRRIRQVPPQVALNLNNLSLPTINIPNLPAGATPQTVAQLVQQLLPTLIQPIVEQAARTAATVFINSQPTGNFEHVPLNRRWRQE